VRITPEGTPEKKARPAAEFVTSGAD